MRHWPAGQLAEPPAPVRGPGGQAVLPPAERMRLLRDRPEGGGGPHGLQDPAERPVERPVRRL